MTKQEIALQIFLKRCPSTYLTEQTLPHFRSTIEDALAIADMFHAATAPKKKVRLSVSEGLPGPSDLLPPDEL